MKRAPLPCAEFPNDNPNLHLGAIWVANEPCDFPSAEIRQIVWESVTVTDIDTAIRMLDEEELTAEESAELESTLVHVEDADAEERAAPVEEAPAMAGEENEEEKEEASVEVAEQTERCVMSVTMKHEAPEDDIVVEEMSFEDTVFESTESFTAEDKKEIVFETDPVVNARTESLVPPPQAMQAAAATAAGAATTTETTTAIETTTTATVEEATSTIAGASTGASTSEEHDPFAIFVRIVGEIVLACGDAALATRVGTLLEEGDAGGMGDDVKAMLGALPAWRGLIRGEEVDFSLCGASTLDEWTAELLARAMGQADRAAHMKQELRRRGVAAFGLLEAA